MCGQALLVSYPDKSFSMTIFCSPAEMLLPALGVEAAWSAVTDTCTQAGLLRAAFTSRRIRGKGPSLVAVPWAEKREELPPPSCAFC